MVLYRVRLEIDGEKNKTIYKRLYDVTAHGGYAQKGKPTHTARMRYCGQDIVVYLIDGQWVSYGEVSYPDSQLCLVSIRLARAIRLG